MNIPSTTRAALTALCAAALLFAGAAQAALQDRDLDGNGVTDAFYDTDLDITWLRDANVNGGGDWASAISWVTSFSLGGYADWRLPSTSSTCFDYCSDSEMGHLVYIELGNAAGSVTNTGGFQNLQKDYYWSGTLYAPAPDNAWIFSMSFGVQTAGALEGNRFFAMAVRNGDVTAVPEPETYALMLAGLAGVLLTAKHRGRRI